MTTLPHAAEYTDAHGAPHLPRLDDEDDAPRDPQWRPGGDAVVALDLDGVCNDDAFIRAALAGHGAIAQWNTALAARTLDPVRVARVQRVCDATGASVVLVTGWRRWASAEDITACLRGAGLTAPVLGAVGGVKMTADLRQSALHEWLDDHPAVGRWCVLDDTTDHYGYRRGGSGAVRYHDPRFIGHCVHPRDGVTDDDAAACVAILGAAPTARNIAPCDDCRAPAGATCVPTCPTRRDPPEASP